MKEFLRSIAVSVLVTLSFVVLVDSFFCSDGKNQEEGAPMECCLQCCPQHHLAPPTTSPEQAFSEPLFEKFLVTELTPPLDLLVDSIFHPPRV